jgi:DNA-binding LytR/AlgR family response regulator
MTASESYVIAEDEPVLAQALARQLATLWPTAQCHGVAANGVEALQLIQERRPAVAFLDVRMPERDGLETARMLCARPPSPLVVFVTAYDNYAIQAFEAAAVDYLLKPVEAERLSRCVARVRERLRQPGAVAGQPDQRISQLLEPAAHSGPLRCIRAGAGQTVKLIPVDEVLWFEARDKHIAVISAQGESIIRTPLRELAAQLDRAVFWQVHRGLLVNSRHIGAAHRDELGQLRISIKGRSERLRVSRQFAHLFKPM